MGIEKIATASNKCLEDRDNIPGAPLWQMGKVRLLQSQASFDLIQNTVDYLACKGQSGRPFTDDEKEFMTELFEALWWGGTIRGYAEAARLADHYVNGRGQSIKIGSTVYQTSVIVKDTMIALKAYIKEQVTKKRSFTPLKSSDAGFLQTAQARSLQHGRNFQSKGRLLPNGCLLAEQSNQRLKNTDNRFFLSVSTVRNANGLFFSTWKVESLYDFEPFSAGHVTNIPLADGFVLKLPDGLSQHLTTIGVAQDFAYAATWTEWWEK
ncbi:hypothetical protein [Denitromonas iodatirespirans]|uniref:Uncharacterized protein n=1 Tax=Denitromonas iodatirespirans TaxID=2795389 RepID=A0A944DQL1_DENI1|nr:hypothetical protein [Denitromonas iodatirespirans]MBT0962809.1 hypothetical protein [Denitromonas iodatirespirans]